MSAVVYPARRCRSLDRARTSCSPGRASVGVGVAGSNSAVIYKDFNGLVVILLISPHFTTFHNFALSNFGLYPINGGWYSLNPVYNPLPPTVDQHS
jgi:hypothetical protein